MKKAKMKQCISIRYRILITITVFIMIFAFIIGLMVFTGWITTARETTQLMSEDMNQVIIKQIDALISEPNHINDINQKLIANGIINIADEKERERFFVSVLQSLGSEIYSFTYGTEIGEYYGARRNADGELEIVKNNSETQNHSWYYSIKEDLSVDELVLQTGFFDPRSREWYRKAKDSGLPIYSSIYKHFVMNDLTISAAWPIYDEMHKLKGVLGTHMLLSGINKYLNGIIGSKNGFAYIVEKNSGDLVANSFGADNYKLLEDGTIKRNKISDVAESDIALLYEKYTIGKEGHYSYRVKKHSYHINIEEYSKEGLDWLIVSAVSSEMFSDRIISNIIITTLVIIIALIISIIANYYSTRKMLKPIDSLITAMEQLSGGDLSKRVCITRNDEIGKISLMFNQTADKLYQLVNNLEDKVQERTAKLVDSNQQIQYLSDHDTLTGLVNRNFLEKAIKEYDTEENLPISIVFADLNGLKMVNDIFGHSSGDILIKKAADILKKSCKNNNVIARVGGDEFIILLPKTEQKEAERLVDRIKSELSKEQVDHIRCSLALGCDTKTIDYQDIEKIMGNAENEMYRDKTLSRKSFAEETIKKIISSFHEKSPYNKKHSEHTAKLCEEMGKALGLPVPEIKMLRDAGYLHDIGKLVLEERMLNKPEVFVEIEKELMMQHSVVGYRILKLFDDTINLADDVYAHHEKWDGSGYPKGLRGQEIPLKARIIAIAESFDRWLAKADSVNSDSIEQILEKIQAEAGTFFDPELTEIFVKMVRNNEALKGEIAKI